MLYSYVFSLPVSIAVVVQLRLLLDPIYTWYTFTGVKLNKTLTQYSRLVIFSNVTKAISLNYSRALSFQIML